MLITIAILVFVVAALGAFVVSSLLNERQSRTRVQRERLSTTQDAAERLSALQKLLGQADIPVRAGDYIMFCALSGLLAAGILFVVGEENPFFVWIGLLVGFFLPYSYVSYRRHKRFEKFEELFPEAIDTLARAVRVGHTFTTALEMISAELSEPVAGEFRVLFEEQKFGLPAQEALMNLVDRVPLVDVRFFVTAVMLQRETGSNLAELLDNLSYVIRERFKTKRQVRVYKAQGRLTTFLLMGLPPIIVLVMLLVSRVLHAR
jgi:tight adherence protein B